ncbi:hypothetical protein PRIPAC_95620 [Pristionchus pacificus]|uniref:Uncharacterized protein n=1 Tax=Pristionchus pacificus TaxID=54126 RepID=A0A2A6CUE3_PRIPA|nr:hypothetical protein PRIPAC_95620 [Pristionchus pacificus]|eukprot:PDM81805.1 hypothetical protein PRIPAC_33959 [Pristionchus pacificus]
MDEEYELQEISMMSDDAPSSITIATEEDSIEVIGVEESDEEQQSVEFNSRKLFFDIELTNYIGSHLAKPIDEEIGA